MSYFFDNLVDMRSTEPFPRPDAWNKLAAPFREADNLRHAGLFVGNLILMERGPDVGAIHDAARHFADAFEPPLDNGERTGPERDAYMAGIGDVVLEAVEVTIGENQ